MESLALSVSGLSMTFPGTRALDRVDLQVRKGEIHGLVGHNGSGKSTLIEILAGQYTPDGGSKVQIAGQDLEWESPAHSERLGLRVVHQNLGLVADMSVTENVLMGSGFETGFGGRIPWSREHRRAADQMARLGYDVNPKSPVGDLPQVVRSAVAIARALISRRDLPEVELLLLDEVTATMPEAEIDRLLSLVATLQSQGISVLYVTHHLEEVLGTCDTLTVLRDGKVVGQSAAADLNMTSLTDLVVGTSEWRDGNDVGSHAARSAELIQRNRLEIKNLSGELVVDLSLTVEPGRIVGVSGITGSGRENVPRLVMGALPRAGQVIVGGEVVPPGEPSRAVLAGIVLVPANRHVNAVVPTQNIRENVTLSSLRGKRLLSVLTARSERPDVRRWIKQLGIRSATPEGGMDTLSGGNQQKVILARCMHARPRILVLDEPTQGVDVGAIMDIHARIREIATESAVLVCSSDSLELASLCDEVVVLQRGQVVDRLVGDQITEENLDRLQLSVVTSEAPSRTSTANRMDEVVS